MLVDLSALRLNFAHRPAVTWVTDDGRRIVYSYEQVLQDTAIVGTILNTISDVYQCRIGVVIDHSPAIVGFILAIVSSQACFCPISAQLNDKELLETLRRMGIRLFFTKTERIFPKEVALPLATLSTKSEASAFTMWQLMSFTTPEVARDNSIVFCFQTSGTTGEPKVVAVSDRSIQPNITALRSLFKVNSSDVIYVSSPPTFDPFIIDIFLALTAGASVLFTSTAIKMAPAKLLDAIYRNVTILQMTPTLFLRWSNETISQRLFGENTTLRILVLGGEKFPSLQFLRGTRPPRIFNIYGITEVSCWSTIHEVNVHSMEEVPLGEPIDRETILEIRNDELFIGSVSRKCFIDGQLNENQENRVLFRATGDRVEQVNGQLFFRGRKNSLIKRFGMRTDLGAIEKQAKRIENIREVCCLFEESLQKIIIFYSTEKNIGIPSDYVLKALAAQLPANEVPDKMVWLKEFPLSCHGKVSRLKLMEIYRKQTVVVDHRHPESFLIHLIEQSLQIRLANQSGEVPRKKQRLASFGQMGGNSIKAVQICLEIEKATGHSFPELVPILLDVSKSIHDAVDYLQSEKGRRPVRAPFPPQAAESFALKVFWQQNLTKCVDASSTLTHWRDDRIVSVGSHSHRLINIKLSSGIILSELRLPDRIESPVSIFPENPNVGLVGCYDGFLYSFELETGQILWKFASTGMIKGKALITSYGIIFGCYGDKKNLFCLTRTGDVLWSLKIGSKGILSSPQIFPDRKSALVATLCGTVARVCLTRHICIWKIVLASPVFATALMLDTTFLVAEVNGTIHCINHDGQRLWTFKADGNVFSSFAICGGNGHVVPRIVFGCHDAHLYAIESSTAKTAHLAWKISLQSAIYSTPQVLMENRLVVCTISGFINILDSIQGHLLTTLRLAGEIFSTPAVDLEYNRIIAGCRDNNVYCLELIKTS